MNKQKSTSKKADKSKLRSAFIKGGVFIFSSAIIICAILTTDAKTTYVISDGDYSTTVTTYSKNIDSVIASAGVEIGEDDIYYTDHDDNCINIDIIRSLSVIVVCDGESEAVSMYEGAVSDALTQASFEVSQYAEISPSVDTPLYDGIVISVTQPEVVCTTVNVTLDYETTYIENENIYDGRTNTITEGENGEAIVTYEHYYVAGELKAVQCAEEVIVKEAVDAVIEYGTKTELSATYKTFNNAPSLAEAAGRVTSLADKTYTYVDQVSVLATAYTLASTAGHGITASGAYVQEGIIAADPKVLPIGTKVYVCSADGTWEYGYAVVGDTGGSIKGNRIDLYYDTLDECFSFGARKLMVYVISYP